MPTLSVCGKCRSTCPGCHSQTNSSHPVWVCNGCNRKYDGKCCVCGNSYEYCGHCDKQASNNTWKLNYCSENCREIFRICSKFEGKLISIEEAKEGLNKLYIGKDIQKSVADTIRKIMEYKSPVVEIVEESIENPIEEVKPKRSRRRRNKSME